MNSKKYDEYEIFSNNIKKFRKESKYTQEQLAEKADCSISYIKQIESQKSFKNVTLVMMIQICEALDVSLADLFKA